jgi:chloramphenicol-sensitive protein RarD
MSEVHRGVLFGVSAYTLWGLTPLFWPLLFPAGPVEILAWRIVWSLVAVLAILALWRRRESLRRLDLRTTALLGLAAVVISVNWGTFIYAVSNAMVLEAALGYFINPLVSVAFGVFLLKERLRRAQWVAVGLGVLAVVVLTVDYGRIPWAALVVAFSFGTYGLIKKRADVSAVQSLTVETALLLAPAGIYLALLHAGGTGTFGHFGVGHAVLLAVSGLITLVPLLLFTGAARRVPLATIGLLQYIAPSLQFLLGVFVFAEDMPASRWVGFIIVWAALSLFSWDAIRAARTAAETRRRAARLAAAAR